MHTLYELTASRSRLLMTLSLAVGVLTIAFLALTASAPASSGGISAGGSSSTEQESAPASSSKYARIWDKVPAKEKRWARTTSRCESGGDPKAIGGDGAYRGAFQFLRSTWKASPKSPGGDPINYDYRTQAVVAVLLKKRDGAGHWPVCG